MKTRAVPITEVMVPLRAAIQRFSFSALLLLSVVTILVGKANAPLVERARDATADVIAPILGVLSQPVAATRAALGRIEDLILVYRENDRLRAENAALLQWQQVARRLDSENAELRGLTGFQPTSSTFFVSGQVIGTAGGAFSRNLLINRGSIDGVAKGQAAVSGTGLLGRIAEVGDRSARILLLTDINSRVPVALDASHERAILAGDNSDLPQLVYLSSVANLHIGDRVVTSGDGGVFPPGIPVGIVAAIEGALVRVAPLTDVSRVDYVRVVDYGLGGVLPPGAAPLPKPPRHASAEPGAKP